MVTDTFAGDMPNLTEHSYFPFGEDTENREKFPNTGHLPYPRSPLIFPRTEASPHFPDALFGTLLNIPDVAVEKTETSGEGDVTITVRSTAEGARCHKCGQEIGRPYGHGREILLRHLSVFGRKTYIRICPPRYQCPRCEGAPVTTQKASWHDQRAPHTTAYEEYALFRMVSSTVEDVSIREYPGYEAVTGIINRRISTEVNWDETDKIDVIGLDEISLKKGHRDFVTTVTALTGGETMILAVLGNRKKETVRKFLKTVPKRLRKKVRGVCSDMCDGFINAVREVFGKRTRIIIDRFHVAQLYRKNLDKFRRKEMRRLKGELPKDEYGELKGAMWALRKKEEKLSEEEREVLKHLFTHSPELELAYNLCRELTDILEEDISRGDAKRRIRNWKTMVRLSGPDCFDSFLKTLEKLTGEITNYFVSRQTGGFAEGLNNKIKVIKRRCYGMLNIDHLFQRIFLDIKGYSLYARS